MHPDQLGAFWPTPDLPLQVILGLQAQTAGTREIVSDQVVLGWKVHDRSAVTLAACVSMWLATAVTAGVSAQDILVLCIQPSRLLDTSATGS